MLAVVVVARDEADRIGRCLSSVRWADERLVLVDERSRDGTATEARRAGATVLEEPWRGHAAQRNHGLSLVSAPWALHLDADEWLTPDASASLQAALEEPGDRLGFSFARCSRWRGRALRHGRWYPDRKVRAVRAGRGRWVGEIHEVLQVDGPVGALVGDIGHDPYRDVWEHLRTIDTYSGTHARLMFEEGRRARAWDPPLHASLHLVDALLRRQAWRDGPEGVAVAALGAWYAGLKWARLRALGKAAR